MIETSLNVNDYPTPPEVEEKTVTGTIILTYKIKTDVPKKWDREEIIEDIKENLIDYISINNYEDIEIDV